MTLPPPLGVENVKIRENSEKSGDLRGSLRDPTTLFRPLKNMLKRRVKILHSPTFFGPLACLTAALGPLACLAAAVGPLAW